ncbi:MAG: hypothetical protein QXO32_02660 [Candidatus Bathyarchaeia archaeon]
MIECNHGSLLIRALGKSPKLRILNYLLQAERFHEEGDGGGFRDGKLTFYKYFKDLEDLP